MILSTLAIVNKKSGYDSDAQLFFTAEASAGVNLTTTQMDAVNQLVVSLKATGIWTKMKALYPIVGGTATAHKFNLKNPLDTNTAFRLSFIGGWVHSATGMLPNGTNAYADTFLIPSTAPLLLNSTHLSYYARTQSNIGVEFSSTINGNINIRIALRTGGSGVSGNNLKIIISQDVNGSLNLLNQFDNVAFYIANRTSSSAINYFRNTVKTAGTANSSTLATSSVLLSGGAFEYSNKECAFASIGDGLSDAESLSFYNAVQTYQIALGRQV